MKRAGLALLFALSLVACNKAPPGATKLACGSEQVQVAFEGDKAIIVGADNKRVEAAKLDPQPEAAGGATVFQKDGLTITRTTAEGMPDVVRLSRDGATFAECGAAKG
jgi:hypothetical protein